MTTFSQLHELITFDYQNELLYWLKIGNYINKTDKLDRLDFLYKQCKVHH
jgi:hypothetical protein